MNYNEMMDKLTRVIEQAGVTQRFIENKIALTPCTLAHYRNGRLKLKEDKQFKLQEVLKMYNV